MKKKKNPIGMINEIGMVKGTKEIQPIMVMRANSLLKDPSDSEGEDGGKFDRYR